MNIQALRNRKQARNPKSGYRAYIVLRVGMLSAATAWGVSSNQVEMCPQVQDSLYHPLDDNSMHSLCIQSGGGC
jgi:hypothetical protein